MERTSAAEFLGRRAARSTSTTAVEIDAAGRMFYTWPGMAMGYDSRRRVSAIDVCGNDGSAARHAGNPFYERLNRMTAAGPPESASRRYPAAVHRLLRGSGVGTGGLRGASRIRLSLRAFQDLDVTAPTPNHSTASRTRRLIDVATHVAVANTGTSIRSKRPRRRQTFSKDSPLVEEA